MSSLPSPSDCRRGLPTLSGAAAVQRLALARVRPATRASYEASLEDCAKHVKGRSLQHLHGQELDTALADYLQDLYVRGKSCSDGTRLLCAILWARPQIRGPLKRAFPEASAALAGWRKLQPPKSRPPLPRAVVAALACRLAEKGKADMGLCVWMMFETYARPSEAMSLTSRSIVMPLREGEGLSRCLTVVFHMEELGRPGKTNEFDASVPLDLPRQKWLAQLLGRWTELRSAEPALWDFSQAELAREFRIAAKEINVHTLAPCLYQLRHGGASHDRLVRARSLLEVQQRGNWRSAASVRRYDKHGRVGLQLQSLPVGTRQRLIDLLPESAALFSKFFVELCAQVSREKNVSSSSSSRAPAAWPKRWRNEDKQS